MTLGDLLAVDMQRLIRRHQSTITWLDLLQPVLERNTARAERSDRFERHEAVPGQPQAVPVPPLVRDQLRSVVGPGVDLARIHTDDRSDAYARSHHADAVTTGRDIYFRSGSFIPHSPAGLGLLAHELTHVAESERPGADWTRATSDGTRREEHLARATEQRVARSVVSPVAAQAYPPPAAPMPANPMDPINSTPGPASATPSNPQVTQNTQAVPGLPNPGANHLRPMHADTDRPPATDPPRSMAPAEPNLDRLKQTLYRDIMSRIRVEFERGA
jgi:Domain of unknown function (DUF4157)